MSTCPAPLSSIFRNQLRSLLVGAWCVGAAGTVMAQGIYTCIDSKGRRLNSDRPILECNDRVQKELNASGTLRREIGPSLTAEELAVRQELERRQAIEQARQLEERRRDRVLLARYPSRVAHDRERNDALAQVDIVIEAANRRTSELHGERRKLEAEAEFYVKDPSRMPAVLKRQIEENRDNIAAQGRFLQAQDAEKRRINERFDEEYTRLASLWAMGQSSRPAPASALPIRPALP